MLSRNTVRGKLLLLLLTTTAAALLLTGVAMVAYDAYTFRVSVANDLGAQADILGLAVAPALQFDDPDAAREYLQLLKARPSVVSAAIYTTKGALFATYPAHAHGKTESFPMLPEADGHRFEGNHMTLSKRIVQDGEILGTLYFKTVYEPFSRLRDYVGILSIVLVLSLVAAALMSARLQKTLTEPILDVTKIAQRVMEQRNFSLRAQRMTDDEVGVLVTAFNGMLGEIGLQTETLEASNQQLQREVAERQRAEQDRSVLEQNLRTLNAELERRVADRTSELQEANKELESFSYSVSHDLRAPIRAIGGFCTLLGRDHGPALDAEAQRKLGIIKSEAERMGALIDDLLAFSRLGRQGLQPAELDMAGLATAVYQRLTRDGNGARVKFHIGMLPKAFGDRSLFEQVWVNLLSNALKFSSKKESPTIEVGAISAETEHVYFVRDNGAGFDQKHRGNLFGVFQRLHHSDEFPGTGVGLALVHRIVTRHGGRIWAEAKVGEGATFHFTVPKEHSGGRV